jgi:tellurite resistance protein
MKLDGLKLDDLDANEAACLLGFLREVVQADGEYSVEEQAKMAEVRAAMGSSKFDTAVADAKAFKSRVELQEAAKQVTRTAAQQLIVDTLIKVAAVDGIEEDETRPMKWLVKHWGVAPS